jgi:hypothetical protein
MFSTSQLISVLLAPLAVVMLVYLSRACAEPKRAASAANAAVEPSGAVVAAGTVRPS